MEITIKKILNSEEFNNAVKQNKLTKKQVMKKVIKILKSEKPLD